MKADRKTTKQNSRGKSKTQKAQVISGQPTADKKDHCALRRDLKSTCETMTHPIFSASVSGCSCSHFLTKRRL